MLIGTAHAVPGVSSRQGIEVEKDPEQLIKRVSREAFDFVLIDVMLPRLTLAMLQKVFEIAPSTFAVKASLIEELARSMSERTTVKGVSDWLVGVSAKNRIALSSGTVKSSSQLVRARSPEQVAELDRRALQAAFAERSRILEGSFTTQEVAALLRTSRQTPHDRVRARTLLAIEDNGGLRFPAWQFDASGPNGIVDGLSEVLKELDAGPLAQARWLRRPNPVLEDRTPLEALQAGDLERVLAEARGVGAGAGARG